jgi:hypothetical protein
MKFNHVLFFSVLAATVLTFALVIPVWNSTVAVSVPQLKAA